MLLNVEMLTRTSDLFKLKHRNCVKKPVQIIVVVKVELIYHISYSREESKLNNARQCNSNFAEEINDIVAFKCQRIYPQKWTAQKALEIQLIDYSNRRLEHVGWISVVVPRKESNRCEINDEDFTGKKTGLTSIMEVESRVTSPSPL